MHVICAVYALSFFYHVIDQQLGRIDKCISFNHSLHHLSSFPRPNHYSSCSIHNLEYVCLFVCLHYYDSGCNKEAKPLRLYLYDINI